MVYTIGNVDTLHLFFCQFRYYVMRWTTAGYSTSIRAVTDDVDSKGT